MFKSSGTGFFCHSLANTGATTGATTGASNNLCAQGCGITWIFRMLFWSGPKQVLGRNA